MNRATLQLVLLVSCAHALVHVYEQSLPSVELEIAGEFSPDDAQAGKRITGRLSNYWRLLWGVGALAAGWLVDRLGSPVMLTVYLLGCSAACVAAAQCDGQSQLFLAMVSMGALASIYHPAGLAHISYETTSANRPQALGIHGIFGSAGIGGSPLVAAIALAIGFNWRQYYAILCLPGILLGLVFLRQTWLCRADTPHNRTPGAGSEDGQGAWTSYFALTVLASLQGFVYSAMLSFLPRYLSAWQVEWFDTTRASFGNYLAAGVLSLGCVGQYLAGRWARPQRLEAQLSWIAFANAPFLLWMGLAVGVYRPVAAALFSLVHFMHQPIYNSLIAKYTPRRRRSLCYGFSFAMGFGLGSFGARFAGNSTNDLFVYGSLSAVALVAGCVGLLLLAWNRPSA